MSVCPFCVSDDLIGHCEDAEHTLPCGWLRCRSCRNAQITTLIDTRTGRHFTERKEIRS